MDSAQIIALASGGIALIGALVVAAYHNGHHNARNAQEQPAKALPKTDDQLDPAFILQTIEDGVVMVDASGVVRLFNPAAANLSGRQTSEVTGLDIRSVLPLVDERGAAYPADHHPFEVAIASGQTIHDSRGLLVTTSGRQLPVSLIVSPLGGSGGAVGVFRDITKEKNEEDERTEFISTASHEMRTPIASIEGYLSLVLNGKNTRIDDETRSLLQKAHDATSHLGQLFQDLLSTTRVEDSKLPNHPEVVDLGGLIGQVMEEVKPTADKKGLSLHIVASGDKTKTIHPLFYVKADPERLREVFRNLIDNAIKYTSAGSVSAKLTGDDKVVQVQVADTGMGIPPEDISHLFQKFYRVDSSLTRSVGGTGLGLFICRKILELYDGRIWVESRLGKGSTFFVNLPRLATEEALSGQPRQGVLQSEVAKP